MAPQLPAEPPPALDCASPSEPANPAGYGGFHMGPMQLALPMASLREVVPCLGLVDLPCPAACVVGGIDLRGVLVPVVDLRIVFGREPGATSPASVIIVVHEARLLGLLVDGITGIFAHEAGSVSGAHYGADAAAGDVQAAALYAGSIRRADTGALVSVLSAAALARLPQVPLTPDPAPDVAPDPAPHSAQTVSDTSGQAHGAGPLPVMLVRCGRMALAIEALAVHATLSDPKVHASVLAQGVCRGVIDYAGQRIAAVDLLALCGLGCLQGQASTQVFVMQFEHGYVGLLVDAVLDVVSVTRQAVVPVPAFTLRRPRLFLGALPSSIMPPSAVATAGAATAAAGSNARPAPLAQFLLLDAAALRAEPELQGLAQTNTLMPDGDAQGVGGSAATAPGAQARPHAGPAPHTGTERDAAGSGPMRRGEMITYELFSEEASPIEQVSEILRYDPGTAVFEPQGAFLGLMIDRGRSIPVICLRRLAGVEPVPLDATSSVLVVQSDGDWVGFVVPRLRAIETAQWSPLLPHSGLGLNDALARALGSREMALVDSGNGARMLRVLDLAGIARSLREEALVS